MARCNICKEKFEVKYFNQKTCLDSGCILSYSKEVKVKNRKVRLKKVKESLKNNSDYVQDLQKVFNTFIRLRDRDNNCISCCRPLGAKYDAGHYRSAGGFPELRFNEKNVYAQCVYCNRHLHGNPIEYRIQLINEIGIYEVEKLEKFYGTKKYSIEELKEMIVIYKNKVKELKKTF